MHLTLRFAVRQSPDEVMAGFSRELFLALAPPFPKLVLHRFDGCRRGDRVELELKAGPVGQRWDSLITDDGRLADGTYYFVDEGQRLPGPLRYWRHKHWLRPGPAGGCVIEEDITYRTGWVGLDLLLRPFMWAQFALRGPVYRKWFG